MAALQGSGPPAFHLSPAMIESTYNRVPRRSADLERDGPGTIYNFAIDPVQLVMHLGADYPITASARRA